MVYPDCNGHGMDVPLVALVPSGHERLALVIIRVLTARVSSRNVAEANVAMRELLVELREQRGLAYAKLARRLVAGDDEEIILIEEWLTPADLFTWTGGKLQQPRLPVSAPHLFEELSISHFESLDRLPIDFALDEDIPADGPVKRPGESAAAAAIGGLGGRIAIGHAWRRRRVLEPRFRRGRAGDATPPSRPGGNH